MWLILFSTLIHLNLSIKDIQTQKPVPHVQVRCLEHQQGTISDNFGTAQLNVVPGFHCFEISHIAYEKQLLKIQIVSSDTQITIQLIPRVLLMPGIQVEGQQIQENDVQILQLNSVKQRITAAEPDIMRAMQMLPSVSSASDFSSIPAIRGLSPNYTRILLAEAPVLNPCHVGGLFNAFDYALIGAAKLYSGVAPSEFGNFSGGLIQLIPRFNAEAESQIEVGLISSKFRTLGSPLPFWKSSFSFRYFTPQIMNKLFTMENFDYYFFDLFWNNQWQGWDNLRLQLLFYFSKEMLPNSVSKNRVFTEEVQKLPGYGNLILDFGMKWRPLKMHFYYSAAPVEMKTSRNYANNQMAEYGFKLSNQFTCGKTFLKSGLSFNQTQLDYHWHFSRSVLEDVIGFPPQFLFFDDAPNEFEAHFNETRTAAFFEFDRTFVSKTNMNAGVRFEQYHGETFIMPRLILNQQLKKWQFSAAYGMVYQFEQTFKGKGNSQIFNSLAIRFPVSVQPLKSQTISFQISPPRNNFSSTLYFRQYDALPVYAGILQVTCFQTDFLQALKPATMVGLAAVTCKLITH